MTNFVKLLQSFKRSNKDRKLKLAQKAGFSTIEDYLNNLQHKVLCGEVYEEEQTTSAKTKPTIHIADVIDCSGSMSGDKIRGAIAGINDGIEKLKKDTTAVYLYTLCHFSNYSDIKFEGVGRHIENVSSISFRTRGSTALYDAIAETIEIIGSAKNEGEKVLINVYTDGQENDSRKFSSVKLSKLIEESKSKGYTVTFVGTERDTQTIINKLGLDASNTLSYDGSAQGLSKSMEATSIARSAYSAAVVDGLDVSKGFYKNIKTNK